MQHIFGHNIVTAVDTIVNRCFTTEYLQGPAVLADRDFLTNDPLLRTILELLADFGSGGRYFDLNVAGGTAEYGSDISPSDRLDVIAGMIAEAVPPIREAQYSGTGEGVLRFHAGVQQHIRATIERFVRAIARLFTIGPLREVENYPSHALSSFLFLMDGDLGKRDYRQY